MKFVRCVSVALVVGTLAGRVSVQYGVSHEAPTGGKSLAVEGDGDASGKEEKPKKPAIKDEKNKAKTEKSLADEGEGDATGDKNTKNTNKKQQGGKTKPKGNVNNSLADEGEGDASGKEEKPKKHAIKDEKNKAKTKKSLADEGEGDASGEKNTKTNDNNPESKKKEPNANANKSLVDEGEGDASGKTEKPKKSDKNAADAKQDTTGQKSLAEHEESQPAMPALPKYDKTKPCQYGNVTIGTCRFGSDCNEDRKAVCVGGKCACDRRGFVCVSQDKQKCLYQEYFRVVNNINTCMPDKKWDCVGGKW